MSAAADRSSISTQRVWVLTAAVAAVLWAALASLPTGGGGRNLASEAAALCAVMAMFGLRSVPIRWIVRGMALLSGMLLARFGELSVTGGGVGGSWRVLIWLAATAAALALAPSSRAVPGRDRGVVIRADDLAVTGAVGAVTVGAATSEGGGPGHVVRRRRRAGIGGSTNGAAASTPSRAPRPGSVPIALVIAAVALIGASSLLIGPRTSLAFPTGAKAGEVIDLDDNRGDNALVANDTLDMTTRPRLTDEVVLTVRSQLASFWRTETYDTWDGSVWSRSNGADGGFLTDGQVEPAAEDLAAQDGEDSTQEFRIETGFATAVPSAPTPLQVDSDQQLAQRPDATLISPVRPLSRNATYTVRSRQVPTSPELLRATGELEVPRGVLEQYAATPVATERTVELARRITAGAANNYDRVRAIEQWMDDNTEYSLDAPLSPKGVDVVDDFLFESQLGWCEQIASSLVVMARLAGVPARLTTGFTPGEWDAVGGRFVVRERDAHAWAEVWFPTYGWVTFDPTAEVPLAGTAEATPGAAAVDWRQVIGLVLAAVGVVMLFAGPLRRRVQRWAGRRAQRRRHRELVRTEWDVAEEDRIEALGREAGRPRAPAETISIYAAAVASTLGDQGVDDQDLAERGASIDRRRYAEGARDQQAVGPR